MSFNERVIKVENKILLFKTDDVSLYYKKGNLFLFKAGEKAPLKIKMPQSLKKRVLAKIRISERLLRLEPRCAIDVNGGILISWQGSVWFLNIATGNLINEHKYRQRMNNPIMFCEVTNIEGFDDCILYGEYFSSREDERVAIWSRSPAAEWKKVFEFGEGEVLHIHGIVVDKKANRLIVLTGDNDEQSAIWEIKNNFKEAKKLLFGKQKYRSCAAFVNEDDIIFATDTPLEDNFVYRYNEITGKVTEVMKMSGPCIYAREYIDEKGNTSYIMATSVEPDSSLPQSEYRISYHLGYGVKNRYSYIIRLYPDGKYETILKLKKDILPMWLFQFGNFKFPKTDNGLAVVGQSLKKLDGRTAYIRL